MCDEYRTTFRHTKSGYIGLLLSLLHFQRLLFAGIQTDLNWGSEFCCITLTTLSLDVHKSFPAYYLMRTVVEELSQVAKN